MRALSIPIGLVLASGCATPAGGTEGSTSTGPAHRADAGADSAASEPPPDSGGSGMFATDAASPPSSGSGCSPDATNFVYVVGIGASWPPATTLYKFAPDKKTFTLVGDVSCGGNGNVNSMAVDRDGTAWINWSGGEVYQVNTQDASCTPAPPVTLPSAWSQIGMGFSVDAVSSSAETLFVSSQGSQGTSAVSQLATLSGGSVQGVGTFAGGNFAGLAPELTGTGDARLYGFFVNPNGGDPLLGLIDKGTAAVSNTVAITGVAQPIHDWAFSFWGGHFYFYTSTGSGGSVVTDYDPDADAGTGLDNAYATAPLEIVGAGVSTCAPVVAPPLQ